jgi:hypothetical protein
MQSLQMIYLVQILALTDDNEVSWIDTDSSIAFSKRSKTQLSRDLIAQIAHKYNDQH